MADDRSEAPPATEDLEERYDFESFGPREFEEMTPAEWEAAFDPDTWITGEALLGRVAGELRARIADRDVFAVLERITHEGERCLLAYSDEGYALVRPTGEVEGFGTVLRDVKPTVALCSIPAYEPQSQPDGVGSLPDPGAVEAARGDLGNQMLQVMGLGFTASGAVLIGAWLLYDVPLAGAVIGVGFLVIAVFLLFVVANARLSARFRAEQYRERLRASGLGDAQRPPFVPEDDADRDGSPAGGE